MMLSGFREDAPIDTADPRPGSAWRMLATVGLFGCAFSLACDVAMWFVVDGYDPLGQTSSELAAGPHHRLQDFGLVVFALGILATALGLHLRGSIGGVATAAWRLYHARLPAGVNG